MGALLNRLRRAEARVNAIAEERGCSMMHLTAEQSDALLWEQIWRMGGPRAVVGRALR